VIAEEVSVHKEQVRDFYEVIWNAHNKTAIPSLLHEHFVFRGSLGHQTQGYDGFADYVDMLHGALGDYRCIVEELVSEGDKVFAKLSFTGIHQGDFLGYAPTQQRVSWSGCALFSFEGDRIAELWVLGDLKSLEEQLIQNQK
jgi:predicted ester cyclase